MFHCELSDERTCFCAGVWVDERGDSEWNRFSYWTRSRQQPPGYVTRPVKSLEKLQGNLPFFHFLKILSSVSLSELQWLKCKIRRGERYIQVWASTSGRLLSSSIVSIWGGETLWTINCRWGTVFPCVPLLHFNNCRAYSFVINFFVSPLSLMNIKWT